MAVKILIKRKIKESALAEVSQMLVRARINALGRKGYIASETLWNCDNPNEILIISMWERKKDWDAYKDDQSRIDIEIEFEHLFDGPTEYNIYNLGFHHSAKLG